MARVSARVIFVCRVVLGETLSVDWRERGLMGRTPSVTACRLCQLPRRGRPWQRGQVSSSFVNGRKKPLLSCKLSAFAKASPFRERWHGEAVTERVSSETNPFRHFALRNATSPEGNSRPHRSTVKKSLPPYPLLTSPLCPAMMVSYQTVDGLNSWPAKQMGEKQDEREIQKKL